MRFLKLVLILILLFTWSPTTYAFTQITSTRVQPILIIPKDKKLHPQYVAAVTEADRRLQRWYSGQLAGKTFILNPVRVIHPDKTLKDFRCGKDRECPESDYSQVVHEGWKEVHQNQHFDADVLQTWVIGAGGVAAGGVNGDGSGYIVMGDWSLDGIAGLFPNGPTGAECAVIGEFACGKDAQTGAIGHELGHSLNLDSWAENNAWHTLGPEGKLSIMANWAGFPNIGLVDSTLNPEKSFLLKKAAPAAIEPPSAPYIEKIVPEEGEYNQKLEIFGKNFGTANDKNVLLFSKIFQLSPGSRNNLGQTIQWSNNYISAWIFKPFSTDIAVLTKSGLSNSVPLKVKQIPPEVKKITGPVVCPEREVSGAIIKLQETTGDQTKEAASAVADHGGQWTIYYNFLPEPTTYSLKITPPGGDVSVLPNEKYEPFYLNHQGQFMRADGTTLNTNNLRFEYKSCSHLKQLKAHTTINGQSEESVELGQQVDIGVIISSKDDPQNQCIIGIDTKDIIFSWLGPEGVIPINRQDLQNCQSVKILPPQKPAVFALVTEFIGTDIIQETSSFGFVIVRKINTRAIPTINGSEQFEVAIGQTVNVGVQVLSADGKCIPNLPANKISLVWSGPNQDIPIEIPNLQNCQSYPVPVPEIGGVFTLRTEFFGDDNFEASASFAHLTVKKLPVKILTQVNGSAQLTPTPDEPVNIAVRITNEADECLTDLDTSRIYFAWVKSSGDQLPISVDAQNCQPLSPVPLPDKTGDWKLKATFAGDQKYDEMITDDNTMATLSVINPQELIPYSAPAGQPEKDRIITEIKLDDKEVDPTNPAVVSIDLKDHGCQVDQECDYVVRIAVAYSVGDPDYFVLNLHYNPPAAHGGCPNWIRMPNQCSGCGLANAFEQDSCNPDNTRELALGIEDDDCRGPQWCQSQPPSSINTPSETACWINADPDNRAGSDEVCQQNHPDTNRCDQYTPGPYFDGCVP